LNIKEETEAKIFFFDLIEKHHLFFIQLISVKSHLQLFAVLLQFICSCFCGLNRSGGGCFAVFAVFSENYIEKVKVFLSFFISVNIFFTRAYSLK
jgi:hypothetical protein